MTNFEKIKIKFIECFKIRGNRIVEQKYPIDDFIKGILEDIGIEQIEQEFNELKEKYKRDKEKWLTLQTKKKPNK